MQHGRDVERAPVALRRLKTNMFCGMHCRIVEPIPETADHAPYADLTVSREVDFQKHVPFNVTAPSLVGIDRIRFADDLDGSMSVIA